MNTGVLPGAAEGPRPSLVAFQCSDPYGDALTTGAKAAFVIPKAFDGWRITDAYASLTTVSSSGVVAVLVFVNGLTRFMVLILPQGANMSPSGSYTRLSGVRAGDVLTFAVNAAGTGSKGLQVFMELTPP